MNIRWFRLVLQGDITALGAMNSAAPSFDKSGEVANDRPTFRAQGVPPSVETLEVRPNTAFKEERAETKIVRKSCDTLPGGTKPRTDLAIEQYDAEGDAFVWKTCCVHGLCARRFILCWTGPGTGALGPPSAQLACYINVLRNKYRNRRFYGNPCPTDKD